MTSDVSHKLHIKQNIPGYIRRLHYDKMRISVVQKGVVLRLRYLNFFCSTANTIRQHEYKICKQKLCYLNGIYFHVWTATFSER